MGGGGRKRSREGCASQDKGEWMRSGSVGKGSGGDMDKSNQQGTGFISVSPDIYLQVCLGICMRKTGVLTLYKPFQSGTYRGNNSQILYLLQLFLSSSHPAPFLSFVPRMSLSNLSLSSVLSFILSLCIQPFSFILFLHQTLSPPKLYQQTFSLWAKRKTRGETILRVSPFSGFHFALPPVISNATSALSSSFSSSFLLPHPL